MAESCGSGNRRSRSSALVRGELVCRPCGSASPSSPWWSVKYRSRVDAANSCPMKIIGVYGSSSNSADHARYAVGLDGLRQPPAECAIGDLIVIVHAVDEAPAPPDRRRQSRADAEVLRLLAFE